MSVHRQKTLDRAYAGRKLYLESDGVSIRGVFGKMGLSYSTVHRLLCISITPMPPRGGRRPVAVDQPGPFYSTPVPECVDPRHAETYDCLSMTTKQVFRLWATESTDPAHIAADVGISERQVQERIGTILAFFNCRDRAELAAIAATLLPPPILTDGDPE